MNLEIETLGQVRIVLDGQVMPGLPPQRIRCALLVFLAVSRTTSRDRVLGTFWPDRPQEKARHALSQTLYELRRALGEDWLAASGDTLTTTSVARTDAGEFEARVAQGQYEHALELYRGPFLDGFVVPESHEFEDWTDQQRLRMSRLHRKARREAIRARKASGDVAGAATLARQWVELDPEEDEAQHSFIELIAASGQRTDALRQYEQYRDLLKASDLEPLPQTEQLITRIREGETGAVARLETTGLHVGVPGTVAAELATIPPPVTVAPARVSVLRRLVGTPRRAARLAAALAGAAAVWLVLALVIDAPARETDLGVAITRLGYGAYGQGKVEPTLIQAISLVPGANAWVDSSEMSVASPRTAVRAARAAGARYLVRGDLVGAAAGELLTLDLYNVASGQTIRVATSKLLAGTTLDSVAYDLLRAIAIESGYRRYLFDQIAATTASAFALLLRAQGQFRAGEIDATVLTLQLAIEADSGLVLAHHRLSLVEPWWPRQNYAAALRVIDAALARTHRFTQLESRLLAARRHAALRNADSSIAMYQRIVPDRAQLIDAQLGLAEALVHYGAYGNRDPLESLAYFERVFTIDSAFAPIYDHLVDLSVLRGDEAAARRYLAQWPEHPDRPARAATVELRFGTPAQRAAMLDTLRKAERRALSMLAAFFARNALDLALVDTMGAFLTLPGRSADDRARGAQYRLVAMLADGRIDQGLRAWRTHRTHEFDAWLVHACLAGYPVRADAEPMWKWAEQRVARGDLPRFKSTPDTEPDVAAFRAVVHRATLRGDSAAVNELLRAIDAHSSLADVADPAPAAWRASLHARLAILGADTARAIDLLEQSVARVPETRTHWAPMSDFAPQRMLLSRLASATGDRLRAERWRLSFSRAWSMGDVLYARQLARSGGTRNECLD